jgi:hypothetical protein
MPGVSTLAALEAAVAAFDPAAPGPRIASAVVAAARASVERCGLILLGEVHGVRQTPLVIRDLLGALGLGRLALEWPAHLAAEIRAYLRDGEPPGDDLWLWAGDGRITAGHLATLRALTARGPLDLTLFDVQVPAEATWSDRDAAMAAEILRAVAAPALVVAGNAHTPLAPTRFGVPMGARLAAARPGIAEIRMTYHDGGFYNFGPRRFRRCGPGARWRRGGPFAVPIPGAVEAVVPHRPWA